MLEAYAAALIFFHSSYACILKWVNPLSSFVSVHTSFFFSLYLSLSSPSLSPFLFFSQSSLLITLSLLYFSDQLLFIFLSFFYLSNTLSLLSLPFFTSFFSSHIAWLDISHSASSLFFFFLPCIYGFHTHMLVHLISFSSKEFCHQPAMLCPIFSCMLRTLYRHPFCYLLLNSSTLNHYQASKIW